MLHKTQAIFFDIDCTTFLHSEFKVPDSTMAAFYALKEKGIKIAICTSRSKAECVTLPQEFIDVMDGIIYGAGSLIEVNHKPIITNYLDHEDAKYVLGYCRENNIVVRWVSDNGDGYFDYHEDSTKTDIFDYLYRIRPTLKKHTNEKLIHLLLYPNQAQQDEMISSLKNSSPVYLSSAFEVCALNVSKGYGIESLAKYWNIPITNTMAFGDGLNDIDMIKTAGIGVSMGNGHQELKNVADYVCENIEDDGVYKALVKFNVIDPIEKYHK